MKPILPVIEEFPNDVTTEEGRQVLFKVKVKIREIQNHLLIGIIMESQ